MSVFRPSTPQAGGPGQPPPDPRLAPTPDYGKLGPGSDCAKLPAPAGVGVSGPPRQTGGNRLALPIVAMLVGISAALTVSGGGGLGAIIEKISGIVSPKKNSEVSSSKFSAVDLERQKPQKQVELLLSRAVSRNDGATEQIQAHVDGWRGKIRWNEQISQLTTVALNSNDQTVRASAIEVQLAAYGLSKSESTADRLIREAESRNQAQKIWALWALGLLGNRGIESDRVVEVLTSHLKGSGRDSDEESRHWAVEALALVGTTSTIAPLLDAMHNDSSALVRERAACSLAESGMLTHEQRLTAVPQLINYSDDPELDAQTHAWAFQALGDITKQRLPHDSAAWRNWYQEAAVSGQ